MMEINLYLNQSMISFIVNTLNPFIEIDEIISQGFSASLIRSSTIVVNNLVSSNYAEARNIT